MIRAPTVVLVCQCILHSESESKLLSLKIPAQYITLLATMVGFPH